MEKLTFVTEEGENIEFFVIEETRVNNINYILVSEQEDFEEDEEVDVYILKDLSNEQDTEAVYEFVEDDSELEAVGKIFDELMDDDIDVK